MTHFEARSKGRINILSGQRIVLDRARLRGENYSDRKLLQFVSIGSRLIDCRFNNSSIRSAAFGSGQETSEFSDCTFDGARINMAPGGFARFIRCSFRNVEIQNWICFAVELIDCKFSGRLRRAIFNGRVKEDMQAMAGRTHNEFRGNDFSTMDLVDVTFRTGIDLTKQVLPSGRDYLYLPNAVASVKRTRSCILRWDDLESRRAAMAFIKALEYTLTDGQQQILLRTSDYPSLSSLPKHAVDEIFVLLQEGC
jgi:hypothetical protein